MAGNKKLKRYRRTFMTMNIGHFHDNHTGSMGPSGEVGRSPDDSRDAEGSLEEEGTASSEHRSNEELVRAKFESLKQIEWGKNVRAVALAFEKGEKTGNYHVQGYVELFAGRTFSYYGKLFGCKPEAFSEVKDAAGGWAYCAGTGKHEGKEGVLDRFQYGDPALYGGVETRADLKRCVDLIVDGNHPTYILRHYPYAYTVHRTRIWRLWVDLREMQNKGVLSPVNKI